jgi:LuxR family maltose regulon positive regulatory protein
MRVPRAKITAPRLPSWFVSRQRLLSELDSSPGGAVTLVSAPPGFGKSLLLADWAVRSSEITSIWVTVDRHDDAGRLWASILAALRRCPVVPSENQLHQLQEPSGAGSQEFLADLADALATLPVSVRLVLDNLEEISDPEVMHVVHQLVRTLPEVARVVLCARRDPPLTLSRLRLEGRLCELRAEQLRLTLAETDEVLTASGQAVSPPEAALLHQRTGGWVAGLRLAATSLSGAVDRDMFLTHFGEDEHPVADYLNDEVLAKLPAETRDLLSLVSICDPVPAELAAELSGRPDAAKILNGLERDFGLIARGPTRSDYQIQVLLRAYLRADLARRMPAMVSRLSATSAVWWAARDRPVEALRHAQDGASRTLLTTLLRRFAVPLLLEGEHACLRDAFDALGDAASADPLLVAVSAAARARTDRLDGQLDGRNGQRRACWFLPGASELAALTVAANQRALLNAPKPHTAELGPVRLAVHQHSDNAAAGDALAGLSAVARAADRLHHRADRDSACQNIHNSLEIARAHGYDYLAMQCEALLAVVAMIDGDHQAMSKPAERALADAAARDWRHTVWCGAAGLALGYAALLRAEPTDAGQLLARAIADDPPPDVESGLRIVHGAAAFDLGKQVTGLREMQHARAAIADRDLAPAEAAMIALLEAQAAVAAGHLAAARTVRSWLTGRVGQCGETLLMRAWEELHAERTAEARALLRPVLDNSSPPLLAYVTVDARLLAARLDLLAGDRPAARRQLRRALAAAAPLGLLRPFVLAGHEVHELLLHQLGSFGVAEAIARDALAAVRRLEHASMERVLSEREIAVLSLLPTLLSLEKIADRLGISINTVKSHTRAIYAKLGVSARRAAVVTAYERGLLHTGRVRS